MYKAQFYHKLIDFLATKIALKCESKVEKVCEMMNNLCRKLVCLEGRREGRKTRTRNGRNERKKKERKRRRGRTKD